MELQKIYKFGEDFSEKNSELVVSIGYSQKGLFSKREYGAHTRDFIFDIASVTKVVQTAYLLMILTEQGKLHPSDKLNKFKTLNQGPYQDLSLKELLTHTSGLQAWWPFYLSGVTRQDIMSFIESHEFLKKSQRGKRVYSDIGFIIIGVLIEEITQQSLAENFKKLIRKPLGLKNTLYQDELGEIQSYQTSIGNPFEKEFAKKLGIDFSDADFRNYPLKNEVNDFNCFKAFEGVSGHCGLFSCTEDLNILGKSLLGNQLVSDEITNLYFDHFLSGNAYGLLADPSLMKFDLDSNWRGHHGFTGCSFFVNRSTQEVLSFLSNRQVCGLGDDGNYPTWKYDRES